MKTVLLVSNRLPTEAGGRAEKFATRKRLLEDHGWKVVVGYVPQPYVQTFLPSLRRCLKLARTENVDVINSVNNPFHLHLIGFITSKLTNTPWLAELRDPISTHPDRNPRDPTTWAATAIEKLVLRFADQIVWFDGIQLTEAYFKQHYPTRAVQKLPFMGYERALFDAAPTTEYDTFTMTYAGSFYEGWIEPYAFLEGLGAFVKHNPEIPLTVQFYGDWNAVYDQAATEHGVSEYIETYDPIPHDQLIPILKGSDAVLYIGGSDTGNTQNIPSKMWDYIGAHSPILAVVDTSFRVANFIETQGLGVVASPANTASIHDAIETLVTREFVYDPDPAVFARYTREHNVSQFAAVLDAVVARTTPQLEPSP